MSGQNPKNKNQKKKNTENNGFVSSFGKANDTM